MKTRMARRALRDTDPCGGFRHAALGQQSIKSHEQVQVEGTKMNLIHECDVPHPLATCPRLTQIQLAVGGRTTPRRLIMFVVLGATGNTGKVVASTLLAQGKAVRVVVHNAAKGDALKDEG